MTPLSDETPDPPPPPPAPPSSRAERAAMAARLRARAEALRAPLPSTPAVAPPAEPAIEDVETDAEDVDVVSEPIVDEAPSLAPKPDPAPEPEPEAEPVETFEPVVEPEAAADLDAETAPLTEPEPVADFESEPEVEPEPVVDAEPEPASFLAFDADPGRDAEPLVESEPEAAPEPEPVAELEPDPDTELVLEPNPGPEQVPDPEPEPEPETDQVSEPEPEPEPVAAAPPLLDLPWASPDEPELEPEPEPPVEKREPDVASDEDDHTPRLREVIFPDDPEPVDDFDTVAPPPDDARTIAQRVFEDSEMPLDEEAAFAFADPRPRRRIRMLFVAVLVLAVGAGLAWFLLVDDDDGDPPVAVDDAADADRVTEVQDNIVDLTTTTEAAPIEQQPLTLVDSGARIVEARFEDGEREGSYAVVFVNPNDDRIARNVEVEITLRDAFGNVIDTTILFVEAVLPRQEVAAASLVFDAPSTDVAAVEATFTPASWIDADGIDLGGFTFTDVVTTAEAFRGFSTTFTLTSAFETTLEDVGVTAVYRDAEGNIVGGATVFLESVAPDVAVGDEVTFFVNVDETEVATTELYATVGFGFFQ